MGGARGRPCPGRRRLRPVAHHTRQVPAARRAAAQRPVRARRTVGEHRWCRTCRRWCDRLDRGLLPGIHRARKCAAAQGSHRRSVGPRRSPSERGRRSPGLRGDARGGLRLQNRSTALRAGGSPVRTGHLVPGKRAELAREGASGRGHLRLHPIPGYPVRSGRGRNARQGRGGPSPGVGPVGIPGVPRSHTSNSRAGTGGSATTTPAACSLSNSATDASPCPCRHGRGGTCST